RRRFITGLVIALAPLGSKVSAQEYKAQQALGIPRVGLLRPGSPPDPYVDAFRRGLNDMGHVERQTITLEYRWAEGRLERLPRLAAELVQLKVDVIVTQGTPATLAAKQASTTIPIVMVGTGDPLATGLVASLARPGGNVTGSTQLGARLAAKRLEILKETVP